MLILVRQIVDGSLTVRELRSLCVYRSLGSAPSEGGKRPCRSFVLSGRSCDLTPAGRVLSRWVE